MHSEGEVGFSEEATRIEPINGNGRVWGKATESG